MNREWFDYARVLISTNSLDMVNTSDRILVDGEMVEIKIIEEWGFNLGDDVCLYDEEDKDVSETQEKVDTHDDFEIGETVDALAKKIAQDLQAANDTEGAELHDLETALPENTDPIMGHVEYRKTGHTASTPAVQQPAPYPSQSEPSVCKDGTIVETEIQVAVGSNINEDLTSGVEGSASTPVDQTKTVDLRPKRKIMKAGTSYSLGNSGPWSVDWLQNFQHGDQGLISSKNKRLTKVAIANGGNGGRISNNNSKKKAGGVLRHPVFTFKKVARLPIREREEVMRVLRKSKITKVLKQKIQNRRLQRDRATRSLEAAHVNSLNESSSLGSANNDWSNWVALNGSEASKAVDAQCIGKTLGVTFLGECHNKFSVLSRSKKVEQGPVLTPSADEVEDGVEGM